MRRPRIKSEHKPVRYTDGRIRIGGSISGIAADVVDPDGWVWALLGILDGTRSVEQVAIDLVALFPDRPAGTVRAALDDLIRAGYVEDADDSLPTGLTANDRERYGRGRALLSWMDRIPRSTSWDAQLLLRQAQVAVIGMGGVGSAAALALTLSGVGRVHCLDRDIVCLSDLNHQILYTEEDLGRTKISVAVDRLRAHNSDVTITGEQLAIDGPNVLRKMAMQFDLLLLASDQPQEILSWTNQACHATSTAWVSAGYHGPQINIGLYRPGYGPCYDCARVAEEKRRAALPQPTLSATADSSIQAYAANAVSANIAGSLAAHSAISLISGVPALPTNCQFAFNLVTMQDSFAFGPDSPIPDCPTCGHAPGASSLSPQPSPAAISRGY